jgi:hypothetical protein
MPWGSAEPVDATASRDNPTSAPGPSSGTESPPVSAVPDELGVGSDRATARPVRGRKELWWVVVLVVAVGSGLAFLHQQSSADPAAINVGGPVHATVRLAPPSEPPARLTGTSAASSPASAFPNTSVSYLHDHPTLSAKLPASLSSTSARAHTRSFSTVDRAVTVTFSEAANPGSMSPASAMAALIAAAARQKEKVSYRHQSGAVVALSGTVGSHGDRIVYIREVVGSSAIYAIRWTYPAALKSLYDPALEQSVATFKPGPL